MGIRSLSALLVLLSSLFPSLAIICLAADYHEAPAAQRAVVRDDGNNLREFGGPNYKQAGIIAVLNQGEICHPEMARRFAVDLDGNGRDEYVLLLDRASIEGGEALLEVRDAQDRVLWKGPESESPLLFFCRDWGIYWPSVIGDIDGDGRVELLAQEPQSDVSPSSFSLARWNGNAFEPVSQGWSLLESPFGSGWFVKARYEFDDTPVSWIMDVLALENGLLRVSVYQFADDSVRAGAALVHLNEEGARVVRWIEPLASP